METKPYIYSTSHKCSLDFCGIKFQKCLYSVFFVECHRFFTGSKWTFCMTSTVHCTCSHIAPFAVLCRVYQPMVDVFYFWGKLLFQKHLLNVNIITTHLHGIYKNDNRFCNFYLVSCLKLHLDHGSYGLHYETIYCKVTAHVPSAGPGSSYCSSLAFPLIGLEDQGWELPWQCL